jgi:Na+-transporting methylmalonyl-CoA/oxaloacetate decarboxylase gamma subunit
MLRREEISKMDNIVLGFEVMIVGFSVVMITLFLLYLVLVAFGRIFSRPALNETVKKQFTEVPPAVLQEAQVAPVAAAVSLHQAGTAPEIVAAITAAVSVCLGTPSSQFEIVSLQPAPSSVDGSHWTISGRKRLMEMRQDFGMFRRERR